MKWGTPMTQETPYGNHINLTHSHNCSVKKGAEQPGLSHVYSRKMLIEPGSSADWARFLMGFIKTPIYMGDGDCPIASQVIPKTWSATFFLGDMIHVEKGSPILGHLTMVVIILKLQDQSI